MTLPRILHRDDELHTGGATRPFLKLRGTKLIASLSTVFKWLTRNNNNSNVRNNKGICFNLSTKQRSQLFLKYQPNRNCYNHVPLKSCSDYVIRTGLLNNCFRLIFRKLLLSCLGTFSPHWGWCFIPQNHLFCSWHLWNEQSEGWNIDSSLTFDSDIYCIIKYTPKSDTQESM